jgi:hypothetical protein
MRAVYDTLTLKQVSIYVAHFKLSLSLSDVHHGIQVIRPGSLNKHKSAVDQSYYSQVG